MKAFERYKFGGGLACCLTVALSFSVFALDPGEVVKLDDKNSVYFTPLEKGHVRLDWLREGVAGSMEFAGGGLMERYISSQIRMMVYANKDELWIISRLGRRLAGCVLLNLEGKGLTNMIRGQGFSVSRSGQHLFFAFPYGKYDSRVALFVDDAMVYPAVRTGFQFNDELGFPLSRDGEPFFTLLADSPASQLVNLTWDETDNLEIWVMELIPVAKSEPPRTEGHSVRLRVTGIETESLLVDRGSKQERPAN